MRPTALILTLSIMAAACGSSAGGGGGGLPCALDGSCPAGYTCGAGSQCMLVGGGAGGDADGSAAGDSGAADVADSQAGDTAVTDNGGNDANVNDSGAVDTTAVDSGPLDTGGGSSDVGGDSGQDVADAGGGKVEAIAALQKGTASQICAKNDGEATTIAGVTLDDAVATAPIAPLGSLRVFYVRPLSAKPTEPAWQGMKVVVFGKDPLDIAMGDLVRIRGDVVEYFCETEIKTDPGKIEKLGAGTAPQPYPVAVAAVAAEGGSSEAHEGVYVEISDVQVVSANVLGTDGKPHGTFAVAPAGSASPIVHIAPSFGTTFTKKDAGGDVVTTLLGNESFASIRGHLTYSFGAFQLRPTTDADLIKKP